ncbi:MAG: hypothetical protein AAFX99_32345, partial [Myxococcota bacterium]
EDQKRTLLDEITTILPPGVADHLKTFVTHAKVAEDIEDLDADLVEDTWMNDVFTDAGYELESQGGDGGAVGHDHPQPPDYSGDAGGAFGVEVTAKAAAPPASATVAPPPKPVASAAQQQAAHDKGSHSKAMLFALLGSIIGLVLGAILGFVFGSVG